MGMATGIAWIGEDELLIRGFGLGDLAREAGYAEFLHLLWLGELPDSSALEAFSRRLATVGEPPSELMDLLHRLPRGSSPLDRLACCAGLLAVHTDNHEPGARISETQALQMLCWLAVAAAGIVRVDQGLTPVHWAEEADFPSMLLHLLRGHGSDAVDVLAMRRLLIVHAEHELAPSTLCVRIAGSMLAPAWASLQAGLCALNGPEHGGANVDVLQMLERIGKVPSVMHSLERLRHTRELPPGFGHRLYRLRDPRVEPLRQISSVLAGRSTEPHLHAICEELERQLEETERAGPPESAIRANVDLYSATCYHYLGIRSEHFGLMFAVARCAGWLAHLMEQYANNRPIRPRAAYQGESARAWVPMAERSVGPPATMTLPDSAELNT